MYGATSNKAIIEIPKGSRDKYEIDKETGLLVLDRTLSIAYPANYGFIPNTLSEDGDCLDIFVFSHQPIPPLTVLRYKMVGCISMLDNGVEDDKIIATLPNYNEAIDISAIALFLQKYKEGVEIKSLSLNIEEANRIFKNSITKFLESEDEENGSSR